MYEKRTTIMAMKEFADDMDEELVLFKSKEDKKIRCMDVRVRTKLMMLYIVLFSFSGFLLFGLIAYFNPMYEVFGPGIVFSRGAALAIIFLTMLVLLFVSYDTLTWIRNTRCG